MSPAIAKKLDTITDNTHLKNREVAELVGTTPQTVSRWKDGEVHPHRVRLERLLSLTWLAERLRDYYEPDEARLWLFSPHSGLGGGRPVDRIQEGKMDEVLALIDQLDSGAYL